MALHQALVAVTAQRGSPPAELELARLLHARGDDEAARDHLAVALIHAPEVEGGGELAAELGLDP